MELSLDLLEYTGKKFVLLYNFYTNKMCLVKHKLYHSLKNQENISELGLIEEINLLIKKGIIIKSKKEYEKLDYSKIYENKVRERLFKINTVYFHITQRCNLNCTYCYNKKNLNKKKELSFDKVTKILKIFKNMDVKNIILTGGEALLREDIINIAKFIKYNGFRLEVLTNGSLLEERSEILEMVDSIIISIDTFDSYKNLRIGLNINKLVDILKKVKYTLRKKIYIRSVISSQDIFSWKEIKMFCEANGYKFLKTLYIPNSNNEIKLIPSVEVLDLEFKNEYDKFNLGGEICGAGFSEIALDSNGDIYPCQTLIQKPWKIGNILDKNWDISITNAFKKRNLNYIQICKTCKYKYLCGGGCPAISYNIYNSIQYAPLVMCNFIKAQIDNKIMRILDNNEKNN